MVQITGKYKRTSIENFEEFLNEVGVGMLLRKAALASTPTMEISKSGEKWKMVTSAVLKVNTRHQSRVLSVGDSIPVIGRSIGKNNSF